MNLIMSGLDYSKAPVALRERLSFTKQRTGELETRLRAKQPNILGCVLLSTCNRTELYLSCKSEGMPCPAALLCRVAGADYASFERAFVTRRTDRAVRHLMEVACGLRSQIWGEDQIVTQVKQAVARARAHQTADPVLETLFREAVAAGKAFKSRVRLRGVPTSAAAQAVEVLEGRLGSLAGKTALVIGNGEMGRLAAELLSQAGCQVTITLRTYHHGVTVVPPGCAVVPYEQRYRAMVQADVLVSATASPHFTITAEELKELPVLPPFLVDLAIPRDIQPEVGLLSGVTLFNVDDLGGGTERTVPPEAEALIAEHTERLVQWDNYRAVLPALESVKQAITQRLLTTGDYTGLDPDETVERVVSRAVDLLAGGLRDSLTVERLSRCNEIIRTHNRGPREERLDGTQIPVSSVR